MLDGEADPADDNEDAAGDEVGVDLHVGLPPENEAEAGVFRIMLLFFVIDSDIVIRMLELVCEDNLSITPEYLSIFCETS